jgi:uncharacterized protein (DUF302 family)
MEYYFSKINDSFENAIEKVTAALKVEGFGVLTEIDLKATLKETGCILQLHHSGACNPASAYKALLAEEIK